MAQFDDDFDNFCMHGEEWDDGEDVGLYTANFYGIEDDFRPVFGGGDIMTRASKLVARQSAPVWRTAAGVVTLISEMDQAHLDNAANWCKKELTKVDEKVTEFAQAMAEEPINAIDFRSKLDWAINRQEWLVLQIDRLTKEQDRREKVRDKRLAARNRKTIDQGHTNGEPPTNDTSN